MLRRDAAQRPLSGPARSVLLRALMLFLLASLQLTAHATDGQSGQAAPPTPASFSWLNPTTWPVVPVPNLAVDPTSGATLGLIPTWLQHDSDGAIVRIIAPDIVHSTNFGWGAHFRILDFPSADTHWSIVAGAFQRVESNFDARYETGLLRERPWSLTAEAVYDRSGTARFYGIGNETPHSAQSVYIRQQMGFNVTLGWNITHAWQLGYTVLARKVKAIGGHLPGVPSITVRFPNVLGLGTTHEMLQRLSLTYDTRNNLTLPTQGVDIVVYAGIARHNGPFGHPMFTEAGGDGRFYWSPERALTIAAHIDVRYLPSVRRIPFWALSSVGGEHSILGERQTLRGFGNYRFYGRDSFSANIEVRRRVLSLDTLGTRIDLQIAPFFDVGRVFSRNSAFPIDKLHKAVGLGFRGIAAPFVVGYVDVGYGSEGAAVFTGINYPF